ncbi:MAG: glucose-6-phosphate isomerase, partial [Thermoproteota archaeon]
MGPLYYQTDGPKVYYAGYNLDSDYHTRLIEFLKDKEFALCVVSKSGSTIEPAVTFRMLRKLLEQKYGKKARNKIVVITDP